MGFPSGGTWTVPGATAAETRSPPAGRAEPGPVQPDPHPVAVGRDPEPARVERPAELRAVRPRHDPHGRLPRVAREHPLVDAPVARRAGAARAGAGRTSPSASAPPVEPPEAGGQEGSPAPQDRLDVESAGDGQVGAAALGAPPEPQPAARLDPDRPPSGQLLEARAADGDPGGASANSSSGPVSVISSAGRVLRVADQQVGHAQRERVHGAADRARPAPGAPAAPGPGRWSACRRG